MLIENDDCRCIASWRGGFRMNCWNCGKFPAWVQSASSCWWLHIRAKEDALEVGR